MNEIPWGDEISEPVVFTQQGPWGDEISEPVVFTQQGPIPFSKTPEILREIMESKVLGMCICCGRKVIKDSRGIWSTCPSDGGYHRAA